MNWETEGDTQMLVDALKLNGYNVSENDARALWNDYSETMGVSWLYVGDDVENVARFIQELPSIRNSKQMMVIKRNASQ